MTRTIFVTGTDTGVGKTVVSAALLAAATERGLVARAYKPVETGCREQDGVRYGLDCRRLAAATSDQDEAGIASYLLASPVAPMVAAEAEGVRIEPERLHQDLVRISDGADLVVVEGAGGLLVPISDGLSFLDLARQLVLPVLVVAASKLGCINHTLLTLAALERAGLETVGYVLNQAGTDAPDDVSTLSNREVIGRLTDATDLGLMPKLGDGLLAGRARLAGTAETCLNLEAILGA